MTPISTGNTLSAPVFSDEESNDYSPGKIIFFCLLLVSVLFYNFTSKVDEEIRQVLLTLCEWH